ncbi:bacterioferritin [Celerinatantimonas sp. MCCC 1A17872]|uniref:bacterioferritin n=1 Tax=Celerinatantimonas sp. MCCC 1A17872 TaxID=3177514 RepID=UPI0038C2193D
MQGNPQIVQLLNKVLTYELTSINQFFLHARMFGNWGFEVLNKACYKKSIKDMKQADKLIERVLFLEGLPNLQALGALRIGEQSKEMLECNLQFLNDQLPLLRQAVGFCEQQTDYVSRDLLQDILDDEEEHIDWLEAQLYQISVIGEEKYLQTKISEDE